METKTYKMRTTTLNRLKRLFPPFPEETMVSYFDRISKHLNNLKKAGGLII